MSNTIETASLTTSEVAIDGSEITLHMTQVDGRSASLRLPFACITQLIMTLPELQAKALRMRYRDPTLRVVYPVGPWTLEASDDPGQLILTLSTADGFKAAFAIAAHEITRIGDAAAQVMGEARADVSSH